MDTYFHAASWDLLLRSITVGTNLLFLALFYLIGEPLALAALTALILIPPLFMVRGYTVTARQLVIHRPGWRTTFDLEGLESVEYDPKAFGRPWRLFGNGGLYGWIGLFRNSELGNFRAFVTDRRRCVVLRWKGRTLLVSPERPERFASALRAAVNR